MRTFIDRMELSINLLETQENVNVFFKRKDINSSVDIRIIDLVSEVGE